MKFEDLKTQVTDFVTKMQNEDKIHEAKEKEIREVYSASIIPIRLEEEGERYNRVVRSCRADAINVLNTSIKNLEANEKGGITEKIDAVLLTELNSIAESKMGLSSSELRILGEKVLSSGSAICARKLTEIAAFSGIELTMPDPEEAKNILFQAATDMLDFYKNYTGKHNYDIHSEIGASKYCFMANGSFLDDYQRKYEYATTSNLTNMQEEMKQVEKAGIVDDLKIATEKLQTLIHTADLPEKKPSEAAAFARRISKRFSAEPVSSLEAYKQHDNGASYKRVSQASNRPDLTFDDKYSNAAKRAKKHSNDSIANILRYVDTSAELNEEKQIDAPVTF